MLSIILPSRNEQFLPNTIDSLCDNARGEVEIYAMLDGYWPKRVSTDSRVHYVHFTEPRGMRHCLNAGVELARGELVMKLDAHCMVSEGFDLVLADVCQKDWVCVPTRKRLDAENWCVKKDGRPDINYQFIDISNDGLNGKEWRQKNKDKSLDAIRVDDIISCQGSCYVMHKTHWHAMGLLDESRYGTFRKDPQEVMFTTWTSGGRCVRVKDAWYAHLHKGRKWGRGYRLNRADYRKGDEFVKQWWTDSAWDERQKIPLRQIFRRFPDMPGWDGHPWMQDIDVVENPLISICIPCMNRTDDLLQILPRLFAVANSSPPVEICVLDYGSSDGLRESTKPFDDIITYRRYEGRGTYHMAHARNLSVKMSSGDYVLISSADIILTPEFLQEVRERIAQGCVWTYPRNRYKGVVCVQRDEFEAAGGFDERFEWYGKEDKDLHARLLRRGGKVGSVEPRLSDIRTPWPKKKRNYRGHPSRSEMHKATMRIFEENNRRGVIVANRGKEWGAWE